MPEFMLKADCEAKSGNCYKFNIQPIMEKIEKLEKKVDEALILLAKYGEKIKPLEKIVYGMVGAVLLSVLTAIIYLVIKR